MINQEYLIRFVFIITEILLPLLVSTSDSYIKLHVGIDLIIIVCLFFWSLRLGIWFVYLVEEISKFVVCIASCFSFRKDNFYPIY